MAMSCKKKIALITGITGQDGSYLAELLLEKGYVIHGMVRSMPAPTPSMDHVYQHPDVHLHHGNMADGSSLSFLVCTIKPHEIYNLAAQSSVALSFQMPEFTIEADGLGTLRILNAIRAAGIEKTCRFYQASSSELYGKVKETPQSESTAFYPVSPYGVAKLYSFWIVKNFRESYDMFACNGILFNHESPRRGAAFVTQKIVRAAIRITQGKQKELQLGNVDSLRDWGHARDYVEGMWRMLQHNTAQDFVLATGKQHSVRMFCEICFRKLGVEIAWRGSGIDEVAFDITDHERPLIVVNPAFFRPVEPATILGNPTKAKEELGWVATTTFDELVDEMIQADFKKIELEEAGKSGKSCK
jgi:GDPmannose 4,6-dehydratase